MGGARTVSDSRSSSPELSSAPTQPPQTPENLKPTRCLRTVFAGDSSTEVLAPQPVDLPPLRPARQRSVRFKLEEPAQVDGPNSEHQVDTSEPDSDDSARSKLSHRLSACFESLNGKLSLTNGNETVLHRAGKKTRPTVPHIDTAPVTLTGRSSTTPSAASSSPTSAQHTNASPISRPSTAATSFGSSPRSISSPKKQLADECQPLGRVLETKEDACLPPIEEDIGRYFVIPQQEAPIVSEPSITTSESVASVKSFLETHFNDLLLEPVSPRSLRRRRLEKQLQDLRVSHEERAYARQQWFKGETDHLRQMRALKASSISRHSVKGISIAGYDVVRILGKGSFGVVRLVTERSAARPVHHGLTAASNLCGTDGTVQQGLPCGKPLSDVFAMKVIRKSEMLRGCQEGHLRAERDFLVNAEGSRWIVPLIASFQDNTNLYLVMEYMIGGDFLGLLLREDVLDESVAR